MEPQVPDLDYYDQAIVYFSTYPERIYAAWNEPFLAKFGRLFQHLDDDGTGYSEGASKVRFCCGCPSQIRHDLDNPPKVCPLVGQTPEITQLVVDYDVPGRFGSMMSHESVKHLCKFAQVQRATDKILNRQPPVDSIEVKELLYDR